MTQYHDNHEAAAKNIIQHVGKNLVIGVPLGIGKPIGLLNALYQIVENDPSISLTIITGLTLSRPKLHNILEKRFVGPIVDRMLKNYEDPLYEKARELQKLPPNINVIEFFLTPGKYLHNSYVQQHYISSGYTNVVRDTLVHSINIIGQQVAYKSTHPDQFSLSCNTDLFHEVVFHLKQKALLGEKVAIVGEVNVNLPFMLDEAVVHAESWTDIIDAQRYPTLFALPREELSVQDHLIGFYSSCLIKDDSCLQLGIGKLSNAIANALILRHQDNTVYCDLLRELFVTEKFGETLSAVGAVSPFFKGLYASTEMFSDEYMQLYRENILKKCVYDHVGLQTLLNLRVITEAVTPEMLDILVENKIIHSTLTAIDVEFLVRYGIFQVGIGYGEGKVILKSGEKISADLSSADSKKHLIDHCLGTRLISGKIIHAGFFLGSSEFYQQLRDLPVDERQKFSMTSIARTNSLCWFPELLQLQRQQARFINSTMMVTLDGAAVSDGVKNMQEVSGVGGQFDFVYMANNLPNARSILNCRSTRHTKKGIQSTIIWDYPSVTIPRYLRDIVVTEYGIADCRSQTDSAVIQALLNITDSRFQESLLKKAKYYGKVPQDYQIPDCFRQNYPKNIEPIINALQRKGYCKPYPFGSDLTEDEVVIQRALLWLKNCGRFKLIVFMIMSLFYFSKYDKVNRYLIRMQLDRPRTIGEFFYRKILRFVICLQRSG